MSLPAFFQGRSVLWLTVALVLLVNAWAIGASSDLVMNQNRVFKGNRSLDEDYTELRYMKTTDYGQTWTSIQQAGNVGAFAPTTSGLGDFSAICLTNNELCYAVYLPNVATPGVYAFAGPAFDPVLIAAEGDNDFAWGGRNHGGWTDIGKTPNGDLYVVIWGQNASAANTLWGSKSTDGGHTWSALQVLLTSPQITNDDELNAHISDMNSADYCFVVFETLTTEGRPQNVLRWPTSGGAASVTNTGGLAPASANQPSYYIGGCKPIAYDSQHNALYCCSRNVDASGTGVYYSDNAGVSFSVISVPGAQRYPSMTVNPATSTPWVFSNFGVPGGPGEHCAWYSLDEFGYGGNAWTDPAAFACIPFDGGDFWLLYVNQGYWWDADRGVASLNQWGSFTPDGIRATYTADGGATWADDMALYHYETDGLDAGSVENAELVGGTGGVAYIVTCGMVGITDVTEPTVSGQTLDPSTPPDQPGPWVVKAYLDDNIQVDGPDWVRLDYMYNPLDDGEYYGEWGSEGGGADSCQGCEGNERLAGWYYFTLPGQHRDGYTWQTGDTVWFYGWATDPPGNSGYGPEQAIVVGSEFLGVNDPVVTASDFRLLGNYPNPFNPSTYIQFQIPADLRVTMKVYNTLGQEVASLLDNHMLARGLHRVNFDGSALASGVYIYTLEAGSFTASAKMVLLK